MYRCYTMYKMEKGGVIKVVRKITTKYLSIMTVFLLVFSSVPSLSVNAEESIEIQDNEEKTSRSISEESEFDEDSDANEESDSKESTASEGTEEESCAEGEDMDEESSADLSDENSEDSSEEDTSTDCDSEENANDSVNDEEANDDQSEEKEEDNHSNETEDSDSDSDSDEGTIDDTEENNEDSDKESDESLEESNEPKETRALSYEESKTSKLGHIRSGRVKIYKDKSLSESFQAGEANTNKVYYIKKQAHIGGELHYLISTSPSSTNGVVGWVKANDLSIHDHKPHDKKRKTMIFNGKGKTYSKAWGGSKDIIYSDMKPYQGEIFQVHLTEKVGNNTWYRGNMNGKTMWIHSSYVTESDVTNTSRLGHIRSGNVKIFNDLSLSNYETAGSKYTNAVYYIKSQAKVGKQTYYLISTSPSRTKNTVGWVKSTDLSTHTHTGTDKTPREFYFTGKGKAYSKAWGGSKDLVEGNLTKHKSQVFEVNLTEQVGGNTWYRGTINGKTAWVHSSYVTSKSESKTSRLGHLKGGAKLYKELGKESTIIPTKEYTHAVYYIKKQAKINDDLFYLLSTSPSSTKGVVGWAKSTDLNTHTHNGTDKTPKTFYFTGKGKAYNKAWGGNRNLVFDDMTPYKDEVFNVDLTEKVGGNTWYRGNFKGKKIWLHSSYVTGATTTRYNVSLNEAVDIQMKANPQTDKKIAYVSKQYIKNNKVTASALNVRLGPGTKYSSVGTLEKGATVNVISDNGDGWYEIAYNHGSQWATASRKDVKFHLDPKNFVKDKIQKFQFLDLSKSVNISVDELNRNLKGKGVLSGHGKSFIEAGKVHNVNEIYLISHSLLETGNGNSVLAKGVEVGKNKSGKPTRVTSGNRNQLKEIKIVYNMYGIGAYDSCAIDCGAERAYSEGWFKPETAIVEGAQFISKGYVNQGQNTLYKMRWDPLAMSNNKAYGKQYATDIGWASKQVRNIYNLYEEFGITNQHFDIPEYK